MEKNTVGSGKVKRRRQGGSLTWIKQYMPKREKEEFDILRNALVCSLTERHTRRRGQLSCFAR